ncbi:MAG: PrsW family glutamic-type intramembrane protease [Candidatus Gracilibacteria bacterium]|jgi:RsiW-degrading membrane proteinase PrsW (M82 family)
MTQTLQIIGSIALAIVPVAIWGGIFYKKSPESRRLTLLTFISGGLAVFPILIYKYLWDYFPWINAFAYAEKYKDHVIAITEIIALPLSVVLTFMIVGVIEETMKMFSVKIVDDNKFNDIDDAIEFFIIAALGFSFTENILYFYNIWVTHGGDNLILPFIFRSTFSTFAHIMFSGIMGYYYGIAHFAKPVLQDEIRKKRALWTVWLHKTFNLRKEKMFYEEKIFEGLLIAICLHAIFNIFLELDMVILIAPFLICGYIALNHLFSQKENHKQYGKLLIGERNHTLVN